MVFLLLDQMSREEN